ncbi:MULTISPECIES: Tat pathway signal protein [Streptomyces]|uniref:Tat pathway signal protein n=1 Tax=Streptomyces TaxID=1883 RepID=UPI0036DC855C|nr:Tat pathway signal protein [Streptomyces sp. NBC_01006]
MARTRNNLLAAAIKETGWSQEQTAAHFRTVAVECGAPGLAHVSRAHISQWVLGSRPEGDAARILSETLSRRLGRVVTPAQIGLAPIQPTPSTVPGWEDVDTVAALVDLRDDTMDMTRRQVLAYSAAGTALPPDHWWKDTLDRAQTRPAVSRQSVTPAHVEAVRAAMVHHSRQDQLLGGRAGSSALTSYLRTDVADYLARRFPSEKLRRDMFGAAAELVYLSAWMAFDSSDHGTAQARFNLAVSMAAEAGDGPLAGHILRAAAHQAVDLHHPKRALALAEGSLAQRRYAQASPRERALLGVVHARALALCRRDAEARAALRQAAEELGNARPTDEPARVYFFGEASLAHETACTLRDLGDLRAAEKEFEHSVRTRALPFARTHVVTLGYLGAVQARQGQVEAACATWSRALDSMDGIASGRVQDTVVQMRRALRPVLARGGRVAATLDQRADAMLRSVG